jgi:hypothetical protein
MARLLDLTRFLVPKPKMIIAPDEGRRIAAWHRQASGPDTASGIGLPRPRAHAVSTILGQYQPLGSNLSLMCCERASRGDSVAPGRCYSSRQNAPRWRRYSKGKRSIPLFLVLLITARLHIDVAVDVNASLMHSVREVQRCCSTILGQYVGNGMQQYQTLGSKFALLCCEC